VAAALMGRWLNHLMTMRVDPDGRLQLRRGEPPRPTFLLEAG
jgi:hypothetical protein